MSSGGTYTSPPIGINASAVMEDITEGRQKRGPRSMRTFLYLEEQEQGSSETPGSDGTSHFETELWRSANWTEQSEAGNLRCKLSITTQLGHAVARYIQSTWVVAPGDQQVLIGGTEPRTPVRTLHDHTGRINRRRAGPILGSPKKNLGAHTAGGVSAAHTYR